MPGLESKFAVSTVRCLTVTPKGECCHRSVFVRLKISTFYSGTGGTEDTESQHLWVTHLPFPLKIGQLVQFWTQNAYLCHFGAKSMQEPACRAV